MTRFLRCLCLSWLLPRGARLRPTRSRHVVIVTVGGASFPALLYRGATLTVTLRQLRREAKIVGKMEGGGR